jgi:MFS transporter, DHA1 family, multidrug resistance protein
MTERPPRHLGTFVLVALSAVLGLAGTDLILPAIPGLPAVLGGNLPRAQMVLASFTAGSAAGLLLFGALGAHFDQRRLLALSLLAYGLISAACRTSVSLDMLVALRFIQGASGSAAAVFAPGLLRKLYGDSGAVGALGLLGSIESLAPALAPLVGLWLLRLFDWRASFDMLAILALLLSAIVTARHRHLPPMKAPVTRGGYGRLIADPCFMRYAVSQACTLGALLIFVFGAPTVFTMTLSGSVSDFIFMQMTGIAFFIVVANCSGALGRHYGDENLITIGTAISAAGGLAMLVYALAGGRSIHIVTVLFPMLNVGLALRGPAGFHRAIVAAKGDDARGAAIVIVAILLITSLGTAVVAPFIALGLPALTAGTAMVAVSGMLTVLMLPKLRVLDS